MNRIAYQTQKIFFALGTVCSLTVFGGDHLHALERAKARITEIAQKTHSDRDGDPGISIGYAAEEARRILCEAGVTEAVIRLGGTTVNIGSGRRFGVRHPFTEDESCFAFLDIESKAVVTKQLRDCSDNRRLRLADESLASVTLIGDNAVYLSALCNKVFSMKPKDARALLNDTDVEAIFVTEDQQVFTTDGLSCNTNTSQNRAA